MTQNTLREGLERIRDDAKDQIDGGAVGFRAIYEEAKSFLALREAPIPSVKALAQEFGRLYWAAHHDHLDSNLAEDMARAALRTADPVEAAVPSEDWAKVVREIVDCFEVAHPPPAKTRLISEAEAKLGQAINRARWLLEGRSA